MAGAVATALLLLCKLMVKPPAGAGSVSVMGNGRAPPGWTSRVSGNTRDSGRTVSALDAVL